MSAAVRLAATVVVLLSACTLDPSTKHACSATADCLDGYVCASNRCVPSDAGGTAGGGGTAGAGHGGGTGGNPSTIDGGPDVTAPSACSAPGVSACPPADGGGPPCEQTFCGGSIWWNGVTNAIVVQYRILDPQGKFSIGYRNAIRTAAADWKAATSAFVTFQECTACMGTFISVVPGDGDGILNPGQGEQLLPMPVSANGRVSPHRIAHQWGHVIGLSHTYQRPDRDRYGVSFDPAIWCASDGAALPPRCAAGPATPAGRIPAVASGSFGVFDEKSKMNGVRDEGVCSGAEPDEGSSEPTLGDVSAAAEMFFEAFRGWSPFLPIGRSVSPTAPLDYQLAPDVDPVGSPAIAEIEYASPEIFVRGSDDRIYTTTRSDLSSAQWHEWTVLADLDVDADPAVVFAVNGTPETLFLAVRSRDDGNVYLNARRAGTWGAWTALAAPPAGAASAPALASESPSSLAVLVRGGDGLIYWLHLDCADALETCAAGATSPAAWKALPLASAGIFVGKPSAVWPLDNSGLTVAAVRDDRAVQAMTRVNFGGGEWLAPSMVPISDDVARDDRDPGVAITFTETPGDPAFFARNQRGVLVKDTLQGKTPALGGVLVSPPAAVAIYNAGVRTDVAAIIDDHGHPGVWWRFHDDGYTAPCSPPGSCAVCGP